MIFLLLFVLPTIIRTQCIYGGLLLDDKNLGCLVEMFNANYDEAITTCNKFNGSFVKIMNSDDEDFLAQSIDWTFLAGTQFNLQKYDSSVWLPFFNGRSPNKSNVTYMVTRFKEQNPGQPIPETMVFNRRNSSYSVPLKNLYGFLCYYPKNDNCPEIAASSGSELSYFVQNHRCYFLSTSGGGSFLLTKLACEGGGAAIIIAQTYEEQEFLYSLGKAPISSIWLPNANRGWLNYDHLTSKWGNGSPLTYTNFVEGANYSSGTELTMIFKGDHASQWEFAIDSTDSLFGFCYYCNARYPHC